jgi:hypothetical protein
MASKSDFTEQEWETLRRGVTGAGMYVSLADRSFFDTFKEAGALAKHLKQAHGSSQSPLIRELSESGGMGFGVTSSPDEIENGTLDALKAGLATLNQRAPDEAEAYRQFVLGVARSVAEAAKGVGAPESDALTKIEAALGGA